jgi:hypothetical protein
MQWTQAKLQLGVQSQGNQTQDPGIDADIKPPAQERQSLMNILGELDTHARGGDILLRIDGETAEGLPSRAVFLSGSRLESGWDWRISLKSGTAKLE